MLTEQQITDFIRDGFVKVENAFPSALAEQGREILWRATGCSPTDSSTWTEPVIRVGEQKSEPFRLAAGASALVEAFDQLAGARRWVPMQSLDGFPIRFPSEKPPGDDGWHIDGGFEADMPGSPVPWRVNVWSRGRALLPLFLFSDIGPDDAPTRFRVGSHQRMAKLLFPKGENGGGVMEMDDAYNSTDDLPQALGTGRAGDAYVCHPFLVHAAQANRTGRVKFMAQPLLAATGQCVLDRDDSSYSPVEQAIRKGIGAE
ncbi:phytanoyl-CoA dioxygenase family protein [Nocardia vermiculata]|uniref:Phytanoyl-CoA dioxygenase family protein n=1 Tax=Nocardia vermiculata TaxID=257274 RepID=A0A846Y2U5_9NOCA|nr:phytanoyl-CoA dioxygenase family protein [Nocardia vermiculata]NKY52194.1 phytanoyl-CoA dioxygenase family protein [Nocardia vermiculata]